MDTSHEDGPDRGVTPTYDSQRTGPRYNLTSEIGDRSVEFMLPIADPFVRHSLYLTWREGLRAIWGALRGKPLKITFKVSGDHRIIGDVLGLDAQYVGPSRPVRLNPPVKPGEDI